MSRVRALANRIGGMLVHPANRGRWHRAMAQAYAFRRAVARDEPIDLPFALGTRIRCWPDSHVSRSIAYFAGLYDFNEMSFLVSYLRPGDRFLDVGANIGAYSLLAAALVGAEGRVDAIEPIESTAARLRENLALNRFEPRVCVHPVAVGENPGWVDMTADLDSVNRVLDGPAPRSVRVPLRRIDDLVADQSFAFAKLDVEGLEWNALRGASRLLERLDPPIWMVEINGAHERYGHDARAFLAWMHERGFSPALYNARRNMLSFGVDVWDDVFFVARARLDAITERLPGLRVEKHA